MKFVSAFSGIGGFDLGFEEAGMRCVEQIEVDRFCQKVLAAHWPNVKRRGDIREVKKIKDSEVICGGFPCQDLSQAGRRAGLAGERSGLFFEFLRLIATRTPRWIVIENVPGLLSSHGGRDMGTLLGSLAELGYGLSWRVLDAQFFGVPQRRRRVVIVGCLGSLQSASEVLLEPDCFRGHLEANGKPTKRASVGVGDGSYVRFKVGSKKSKVLIIPKVASTLMTHSGRNNPDQTWIIDINSKGIGVRRLTPEESERLQGFPEGWTSSLSVAKRGFVLGNAFPVPMAAWLGRRIMIAEQHRVARLS